jgi:hypothetical protein
LEANCQLYVPATLTAEKKLLTSSEDWISPRTGLDTAVAKRYNPFC